MASWTWPDQHSAESLSRCMSWWTSTRWTMAWTLSRYEYSTAQHSTAQHSTAQHSTAQHSTAQHSTAQHSTAQHSTAQHSTAQHSAAHMLGHLCNPSAACMGKLIKEHAHCNVCQSCTADLSNPTFSSKSDHCASILRHDTVVKCTQLSVCKAKFNN